MRPWLSATFTSSPREMALAATQRLTPRRITWTSSPRPCAGIELAGQAVPETMLYWPPE